MLFLQKSQRSLPFALPRVWDRKSFMGMEMENRTLGILGFGNIGKRVAKYGLGVCPEVSSCDLPRAPQVGFICTPFPTAFGMKVMAYDPFVTAEQGAKLHVTMAEMSEIFAAADVITLHLPSIKETQVCSRREGWPYRSLCSFGKGF